MAQYIFRFAVFNGALYNARRTTFDRPRVDSILHEGRRVVSCRVVHPRVNTYVHTYVRTSPATYVHSRPCGVHSLPRHVLRSPKAINGVGEAATARELLQRFSRKTINVTCLMSFPLESVRDYPLPPLNQLRDQ